MHWSRRLRCCLFLRIIGSAPVMYFVIANFQAMLCETCHSSEATVHLTYEMVGQQAQHRRLCSECFPGEGSTADQVRALFKQFRKELPEDVEIRDETGAS